MEHGYLLFITCIVYYLSADLYMINMEKFDITQTDAILISIFGIILGWIIYDQICRYTVNKNLNILAIFILLVFTFLVGFFQVFSYRVPLYRIGSMLGTIMVANVLMIIIPGQKSCQ